MIRIGRLNEEGVSEAIGFIIMFALVMTGIGLITLYGYPMLMKEQTNANIRNMERNMIVIQNDMKSLSFKNVPYKETDIQVSGGALSAVDFTRFPQNKIDISNLNNPVSFQTGKLRYATDLGDAVVVLENGAVLKRYQSSSGSVMFAKPRWFLDNDLVSGKKTLIINLIRIKASDLSKIGICTVQMKVTQLPTFSRDEPYPSPRLITVSYSKDINDEDDFTYAWSQFFPEFSVVEVDRVVVKAYEIEITAL